jgi:hypothetical protein
MMLQYADQGNVVSRLHLRKLVVTVQFANQCGPILGGLFSQRGNEGFDQVTAGVAERFSSAEVGRVALHEGAQIFFGSNDASAKIRQLTPGAFSDDGVAIHSYYTTAYLAATGISGRSLFGYLTAYVQSAGALALSAFSPGDVTLTALGNWTLSAPASRDMEQFINVLGERISVQLSTNAAGAWFSVTKLVPWAKPDPFAVVRGTNA